MEDAVASWLAYDWRLAFFLNNSHKETEREKERERQNNVCNLLLS